MLAIGRALVAAPKLMMLDEPSLGLSPLLSDQVFSVRTLSRKGGITILLVERIPNVPLIWPIVPTSWNSAASLVKARQRNCSLTVGFSKPILDAAKRN